MAEPAMDNLPVDDNVDLGDNDTNSPASGGEDWNLLAAEMQGDEDVIAELQQSSEAAKPTEEPAPSPVEPAPQAVAQPSEPAPTPVVAETSAQPSTPTPPAPAPQPAATPAPQQQQPDWQAMRTAWEAEIAKDYQMTDEQAGQFITNPNLVIPQLAAKMHASILQQTVQQVTQSLLAQLPTVIDTTVTRKAASADAETQFFAKWPELKAKRDVVLAQGNLYRQANPNASLADFIQNVGISVWLQSGMSPQELATRMAGAAQAAPQPPAQRAPAGYNPATPASRSPPPQANREVNPFEQLAGEMKEDFY